MIPLSDGALAEILVRSGASLGEVSAYLSARGDVAAIPDERDTVRDVVGDTMRVVEYVDEAAQ